MHRGTGRIRKAFFKNSEVGILSESKSSPGLAPRTRLPLRLSEQRGHRFWSAEVAPGRWVGCGPSIAVDRIGAWFICTYSEHEQVHGYPETRLFSSSARLAVPDESCALDKWSWMCFTVRPIPLKVDDDMLGFFTATGVHVTTDVALKAITEFDLGYVVVRNLRESRRSALPEVFAVGKKGEKIWEMADSAGLYKPLDWRYALPWDDGNIFLYPHGTILERQSGKILRTHTHWEGNFKA